MSNTSIFFIPSRNLVSPTPPLDEDYEIKISLSQFDKTPDTGKEESQTLDGTLTSSYYYNTTTYACKNFINKSDPEDATDAEMQMFLNSVDNAEEFTMFNFDEQRLMTCQKIGAHSAMRESPVDVNIFGYQFTVREIVS